MPNIKSAIKRVKVNEKKNQQNREMKSKILTYTKKFKASLEAKNFEDAEKLYREVTSLLDTAARDNTIHANNAARKKAHYAKLLSDAKLAK